MTDPPPPAKNPCTCPNVNASLGIRPPGRSRGNAGGNGRFAGATRVATAPNVPNAISAPLTTRPPPEHQSPPRIGANAITGASAAALAGTLALKTKKPSRGGNRRGPGHEETLVTIDDTTPGADALRSIFGMLDRAVGQRLTPAEASATARGVLDTGIASAAQVSAALTAAAARKAARVVRSSHAWSPGGVAPGHVSRSAH